MSRVYNRIGFDLLDDKILKYLTIARLSQPMSKSATVNYLNHTDEDIKLEKVYRYLDKLYNTQQGNTKNKCFAYKKGFGQ